MLNRGLRHEKGLTPLFLWAKKRDLREGKSLKSEDLSQREKNMNEERLYLKLILKTIKTPFIFDNKWTF